MLTGYNTDVSHEGVVYHVQTEDKGLETPIILSLVYVGGAILASKRAPYDDLIAAGFDEAVLAERISRQHKLICAALYSGRIEDLKRMNDRAPAAKAPGKKAKSPAPASPAIIPSKAVDKEEAAREVEPDAGSVPPDRFPISVAPEVDSSLRVALLEERELRAGDFVTLRVQVIRTSVNGETPVPRARVVLKTLGTSFKPASTFSLTDKNGVAMIFAALPAFEAGRAAILLRAEADGQTAELRRVVLPA
ncbi:MAG TPA: hypothetical protein VLQ90_09770 [Pyrinomonadaceae bacterium]|nr:hypothetical protein [Pyrinomonadaceae bacterium]